MKRIALSLAVLALAGTAQAYDRNELNFWGFTVEPQNKYFAGAIDKDGADQYAVKIVQRVDATLRRIPLADYTPKYSGKSCVVDFRVEPPRSVEIDDTDGDAIACDFIVKKLREAHMAPIDDLLAKRVKDFELFFQFTDYEQYLDNSR